MSLAWFQIFVTVVQKPRKEGGKSIRFMEALLKIKSEMDVARSWPWRFLKY